MKISPEWKRGLMIGAMGIAVIGATYWYVNKNGDAALGIAPGTLNTGLGGFGDLLRRFTGASDASALAPLNNTYPLPPTGQQGVDLGTDINSNAPAGEDTNSSYVSSFFNQLGDFFSTPSAPPDAPSDNAPAPTGAAAIVDLGGGVGVNTDMSVYPGNVTPLGNTSIPTYSYSPGPVDPYAPPGSPASQGQYVSSIDVGAPLPLGGVNTNPPVDAETYNNMVSNSTVPTNGLEGGYIYGIANS